MKSLYVFLIWNLYKIELIENFVLLNNMIELVKVWMYISVVGEFIVCWFLIFKMFVLFIIILVGVYSLECLMIRLLILLLLLLYYFDINFILF